MKSEEIRRLFLEFFEQKGHRVIPSSPLIPGDDPTLLFTNAGMVQFKSLFLGEEVRPYKRATSVQKCLRAGGKHNDLESVGKTARHHTFFEMLGNFSFGDYFKREAIRWAWEFLTEWVKLPKDRLLVTIYEQDDEAASLWLEETDVKPERIFRLGEKDNFWQMGETGPCGPCSEVLIDQGAETGCGRPECSVGCHCDRFLEIWNLVFMQYNRDSSGNLSPLPAPSIDTGMGLERLTAVLQGKKNNFDSDLFSPIIKSIEDVSGRQYGTDTSVDISIRVIADHIRAIAFLLTEGLIPSNEWRGYVLRRIIRRAARHGFMLGIESPFLYKVIDSVFEKMSGPYPELLEDTERSKKVLQFEEERFAHTLSTGMAILEKLIDELKSSKKDTIVGSDLFKLYDTYGFPLDLAKDIAEDNNLRIDEQGFYQEMELQKARARASWVSSGEEVSGVYKEVLKESGPTNFLGYESLQFESTVEALIKEGSLVEEAREGEEVEVVLDRTPFYGEAGGQVGDSGTIKAEDLKGRVVDTKRHDDLIVHTVKVKEGVLRKGMVVQATVNRERRRATMRNHTATHLLQAALRAVLGDHIKQAGSLVAPDRLRFDFTHFYAMEGRELQEVERIVNEKIMENLPVDVTWTTLDSALAMGAIALFGEKYGERVRVVRAGDFSTELCGGTHCNATGEIGLFRILSEGSVAAGVRRIEAVTGFSALELIRKRENELSRVAGMLRVGELQASERLEKVLNDLKTLEKELERIKSKAITSDINSILDKIVEIKGIKVLAHRVEGLDIKELRNLADLLKDRVGSGIIVLGSALDGKASYVSVITKDLVSRFNAGEILKAITGGKGGGRPDMAQGGTKDPSGIDRAISSAIDVIKEKIK